MSKIKWYPLRDVARSFTFGPEKVVTVRNTLTENRPFNSTVIVMYRRPCFGKPRIPRKAKKRLKQLLSVNKLELCALFGMTSYHKFILQNAGPVRHKK